MLNGQELLKAAIAVTLVPTGPTAGYTAGASIGLSFLSSSIKLNHVRRLTDRLHLSQHGWVSKSTELDIYLGGLDPSQIAASNDYNRLRTKRPIGNETASIQNPLWLPVSRLPATSTSPVEVFDEAGTRIPRLTQFETYRLLSAGLYSLARSLLATEARRDPKSKASDFLHKMDESRWLLQSAIFSLLTSTGLPNPAGEYVPTPGTVPNLAADQRQFTLDVLDEYGQVLAGFYDLIEVVVHDYILVIGVDPLVDEHIVRYESPTFVTTKPILSSSLSSTVRGLSTYRVDYATQVPPTLRSYHLAVQTDADLAVDSMFLTTDADVPDAKRISDDLATISKRLSEYASKVPSAAQKRYLEVETQTAIRAAADLLRKREWEASTYGQTVDQSRFPNLSSMRKAVTAGESTLDQGGKPRASLLQHPSVTSATVAAAAREIVDSELGKSMAGTKEPSGSDSQTYWRRDLPLRSFQRPVSVTTQLVLRDAGVNRPVRTLWYCILTSLTAWGVACFISVGIWPFVQYAGSVLEADALVAVLLLVPGFLYSRLDLGAPGSISARLRKPAQLVAGLSIATTVGAAAAIAASGAPLLINITLGVAIAFPLVSGFALYARSRDVDGSRGLSEVEPPRWVKTENRVVPIDMAIRAAESSLAEAQ